MKMVGDAVEVLKPDSLQSFGCFTTPLCFASLRLTAPLRCRSRTQWKDCFAGLASLGELTSHNHMRHEQPHLTSQ